MKIAGIHHRTAVCASSLEPKRQSIEPQLGVLHVQMKSIDSTLFHRVLMPEQSSASRHPTLVMLHGRGADEEDLLGLSSYLDNRLLIVSARAPFAFPYGGGFTWYDMKEVGTPDAAMFKESYEKLSVFVDDILGAYSGDPSQVFLLGFSMGTVMSYALSLTLPEKFSGVVANSGHVPEGTYLSFRWDALSATDFFVAHGLHDPVIPVQFGRRAKELLETAGAPLTYREYPMGHQINEASLSDMASWLTLHLDSQTDIRRA